METGDSVEKMRLPVTCPVCGTEAMTEFPVKVVATALTRWHQMCLYVHCHSGSWSASAPEIVKLREFVGPEWLAAHDLGTTGIAKGATLPDPKSGRLPPVN